LKVLLLSDIIRTLESHFLAPDFELVFVPINRPILENEVSSNPDNQVAADNLRELNRIRDEGMWNGTVKVFEAGAAYIIRTSSEEDELRQSQAIAGSVLNYFLALRAKWFVGTEVSSFSMDLIQSRYFRSNRLNYLYRPGGELFHATPDEALEPPTFVC
jgi:hypothetical protein